MSKRSWFEKPIYCLKTILCIRNATRTKLHWDLYTRQIDMSCHIYRVNVQCETLCIRNAAQTSPGPIPLSQFSTAWSMRRSRPWQRMSRFFAITFGFRFRLVVNRPSYGPTIWILLSDPSLWFWGTVVSFSCEPLSIGIETRKESDTSGYGHC